MMGEETEKRKTTNRCSLLSSSRWFAWRTYFSVPLCFPSLWVFASLKDKRNEMTKPKRGITWWYIKPNTFTQFLPIDFGWTYAWFLSFLWPSSFLQSILEERKEENWFEFIENFTIIPVLPFLNRQWIPVHSHSYSFPLFDLILLNCVDDNEKGNSNTGNFCFWSVFSAVKELYGEEWRLIVKVRKWFKEREEENEYTRLTNLSAALLHLLQLQRQIWKVTKFSKPRSTLELLPKVERRKENTCDFLIWFDCIFPIECLRKRGTLRQDGKLGGGKRKRR